MASGTRPRVRAIATAVVVAAWIAGWPARAAATPMIHIVPPGPIELTAPPGGMASTLIAVDLVGTGADHLTQIQITGDAAGVLTLTDAGCTAPHQCDYPGPGQRGLPTFVGVSCQPDASFRTATLVVHGDQPGDLDTVTIDCADDSPHLVASPLTITAPDTDVGSASGPYPLVLTNAGNGSLTAGPMAFGLDEWSSPSACAIAPCTIANGSPRTVDVSFAPIAWGSRNSTVTIPSGGGLATVQLEGTGLGAILEIIAPSASASYTLDFGTIAKGSPAVRALAMQTVGNRQVMAVLADPPPPFSISPTSVVLDVGVPGTTDVICSSPTAMPVQTTTLAITSEAYETIPSPAAITVSCAIADTALEVVPQTFDFGELPLGGAAMTQQVTLTNPTGTAMTVSSFKLVGSSHVLALSPSNQSLTLAPNGGTVDATLTFDPRETEDVAGKRLEVRVDAVTLSYPITGRVVSAHAHLTPHALDLGTACVGTAITGAVTMVNDGTATLLVQPPTVDQAFTIAPISPESYPAEGAALAPGKSASASVAPVASLPGRVAGTLTWDVNAPEAPFAIPVTLEYIAEGAGVSPSELAFGTQQVDVSSGQQAITIENCNLDPITIEVRGVVATRGAGSAWRVDPRTLQTTLGSHGKQRIAVAFDPHEPGHYAANIELAIAGVVRTIALTGDAPGATAAPTSFYACSCSGTGAPSRGWPIALAIAAVTRRRRRRPAVSDRCRI